MTNEPWKQQPAPEASRIIRPHDTITLTIDNRVSPARVDMRTSSALPVPFVINIFSNLISQLSAQLAAAMAAGALPPPLSPQTEPPTEPKGQPGNGAT